MTPVNSVALRASISNQWIASSEFAHHAPPLMFSSSSEPWETHATEYSNPFSILSAKATYLLLHPLTEEFGYPHPPTPQKKHIVDLNTEDLKESIKHVPLRQLLEVTDPTITVFFSVAGSWWLFQGLLVGAWPRPDCCVPACLGAPSEVQSDTET